MILAVGVDVVGVGRFTRALARTPSLRERLFTPAEAAVDDAALAGCFAAKEALVKALGAPGGLSWHDVEVCGTTLLLHGTVAQVAAGLGVRRTHLHIAGDPSAVVALVTLESCA